MLTSNATKSRYRRVSRFNIDDHRKRLRKKMRNYCKKGNMVEVKYLYNLCGASYINGLDTSGPKSSRGHNLTNAVSSGSFSLIRFLISKQCSAIASTSAIDESLYIKRFDIYELLVVSLCDCNWKSMMSSRKIYANYFSNLDLITNKIIRDDNGTYTIYEKQYLSKLRKVAQRFSDDLYKKFKNVKQTVLILQDHCCIAKTTCRPQNTSILEVIISYLYLQNTIKIAINRSRPKKKFLM